MSTINADVADAARPSHQPIDRLGALASTLCAVHCLLSATLPQVFAGLGLAVLLGEQPEWAFTLVALAFAFAALVLGWRKHRSLSVVSMFAAGMTALLLGRLLEDEAGQVLGLALSILAGLLLVAGHITNIRASRRSRPASV